VLKRFALLQRILGLVVLLGALLSCFGLTLIAFEQNVSWYVEFFPAPIIAYPRVIIVLGSVLARLFGSAAWLVCGVALLCAYGCLVIRPRFAWQRYMVGTVCLAYAWNLYGALFAYSIWGDPWYAARGWIVPGGTVGVAQVRFFLQHIDPVVLVFGILFLAWGGAIILLGVQTAGQIGAWFWALIKPLVMIFIQVCYAAFSYVSGKIVTWVTSSRVYGWWRPTAIAHDSVGDSDFWREFVTGKDDIVGTACALDACCQNGLFGIDLEEEKFVLPGGQLFVAPPKKQERQARVQNEIERRTLSLEEKLHRFGVNGMVTRAEVGPVVTLFEYAPAPDVKVSRISALADDVALALGAQSLRVIAPIPGKQVVGFEVANEQRQVVFFSELFESPAYKNFTGAIPAVIGALSSGKPCILDVPQQPHMLIAGSTGSGKSVVMHALLLGMLGAKTPEELRLVMIDPKRLEFAPYADIPHLMIPIVTELPAIARVFSWLVGLMEERYAELARAGVRSVEEYRARKGSDAMPYIVVVVDELADIMVTVGREVEPLMVRLAQMARAAAIHLIVATQRPSVDVVTGILKVNFPTRIALKVASKVDSRTVIDMPGAEQLLGKGDMLLMQQGGIIERAHGAFVQSKEVHAVASYLRMQQKPMYETIASTAANAAAVNTSADALYPEVISFIKKRKEISISLLQRHFRIGFNRSARLIDQLEEEGLIATAGSGKLRRVL